MSQLAAAFNPPDGAESEEEEGEAPRISHTPLAGMFAPPTAQEVAEQSRSDVAVTVHAPHTPYQQQECQAGIGNVYMEEEETEAANGVSDDPEEQRRLLAAVLNNADLADQIAGMGSNAEQSHGTVRIKGGAPFLSKNSQKELLAQPIVAKKAQPRLGTCEGVIVSCLLNIFGVIMFLRLGWVIGQAGIGLGIVIILLASVVVFLTTLSMSALATAGQVEAGGAYYMISRAVGPHIGAAVGVLFTIGNCVAVAMYVIGFCETLVAQVEPHFSLTNNTLWDVRLYGLVLCTLLLIMALIGVGWVMKTQLVLLVLLVCSILCFVIGCFTTVDESLGITGIQNPQFQQNFLPAFATVEGKEYDFFKVFAVFFPAVTGIMAGANISGELKNPSKAIPVGTMSAVGISTVVYIIMAILVGGVATRIVDGTNSGLIENTLIISKIAVAPFGEYVVLAGIYAATFSSALASIVGAPRILQRLAKDRLLPCLNVFDRPPLVNKRGESTDNLRLAYLLVYIVACGCILIGELNLIAPLISMFFMMTYGLINFSCFEMTASKSPGWRPTFKSYNQWTCLLGALLCVVCMFLTDVLYALISLGLGVGLYTFVRIKDPQVSWGSALESRKELAILKGMLSLKGNARAIRTFRPHYLVLLETIDMEDPLLNWAMTLREGYGLTLYGHVVEGTNESDDDLDTFRRKFQTLGFIDPKSTATQATLGQSLFGTENGPMSHHNDEHRQDLQDVMQAPLEDQLGVEDLAGQQKLKRKFIKKKDAFLECVLAKSVRSGAFALMTAGGLGFLKPNTLIMGFKETWKEREQSKIDSYVGIIRDAVLLGLGAVVVRRMPVNRETPPRDGPIDIWWLMDDGGLTVLIPFLLRKHQFWNRTHSGGGESQVGIRVFILGTTQDEAQVAEALRSYRITHTTCIAVQLPEEPSEETLHVYDNVVAKTPLDQQASRERTLKNLRIAEVIKQRSGIARTVVITLPYPRKNCDSYDYLSWLEMMSKDLHCPTVFMRGNGQKVLTRQSEG